MSLRRPLDEWRYRRYLKSGNTTPLNELPVLFEWKYWILVEAGFKHNRHHNKHLMLVLKRQCDDVWQGVHFYEIAELWRVILPSLEQEFHYIKINLKKMRSVHNFVHIHVLTLKRRYR
jgi:hypothetical protein